MWRVSCLVSTAMLLWVAIESVAARAGVSPYQVVWTRYGTHLIFMLLAFGPRHGRRLVISSKLPVLMIRSLCMLGMPVCFIAAARRMPASDLAGVFWVSPLLVILLSMLFIERRWSVWPWIAGVCGATGAFLLTGIRAGPLTWGWPAALGMAFCFAGYIVLTYETRQEMVLTRLFHSALWVFLSLSLVMRHVWSRPSLTGLATMVTIGLMGWGLLYLIDLAVDLAPPSTVAPLFYSQLIWAALIEWSRGQAIAGLEAGGLGLLVVTLLFAAWWMPTVAVTSKA